MFQVTMSAPPPATLFFTVGVIPNDGRRAVTTSTKIPYTSLAAGLEALNLVLVVPPLAPFIPAEPEEQ